MKYVPTAVEEQFDLLRIGPSRKRDDGSVGPHNCLSLRAQPALNVVVGKLVRAVYESKRVRESNRRATCRYMM